MNRIESVSRRDFLGTTVSATAFLLCARLSPAGAATSPAETVWNSGVYIAVETDGTVALITHRSEMGTGVRSVLPVVIADELEADWKQVRLVQAIGDSKYGSQNTDGSCSIRDFYDAFREAGATARLMLERAAAAKWNVPLAECKASLHSVMHIKSGRKLGYGELASLAAKQPVPQKSEIRLKSPAEFRYIGKSLPTRDLDDITTGKGIFGIDAQMPDMVYASIERSPVYGGKLKSFDDREAKKVSGVVQTVVLPEFTPPHLFQQLGGVAVVATNTWAAQQGREKLKVEWNSGEHASYDSASYRTQLIDTVSKPQNAVLNVGDVEAGFAKSAGIHEATYYTPMLAHAAMEPPAAVAFVKDGKALIHAATQDPQAVQDAVSAALKIDKKNVECHVTLLGGGFGRKSKPDYVVEAALISRSVGKPVKVAWSREDDIRFDYYHAPAAVYMKAGVDGKGRPNAWLQRNAFPTIMSVFAPNADRPAPFEHEMGYTDIPYDIANIRAESGATKNHVRIGWLRSVTNIFHSFARNSFVDELAHRANRDSVEYALDLIGNGRIVKGHGGEGDKFPFDTGRLRRVIEFGANRVEWGKRKPGSGRALGFAAHRSFLSYVAVFVDVEVDAQGKVRIPRVDIVVDAGRIINPDRVKSQFEGAAVFGTSIAMLGEITAAQGEIQQSNFFDYPVARIDESPRQTNVHIIGSDAPPAGVGEPGVPPIAPAICNAIFAATGKRLRELPVKKQKLV